MISLLNPYTVLAALGSWIIFFFWGYHAGESDASAAAKKAEVAVLQTVAKQEHEATAITNTIATQHEVKAAEQQVVYKTIYKDVIRYVQAKSTPSCKLDAGWVRLHDAAVDVSAVSDSSSLADAAPSKLDTNDALTTVTTNYGTCNEVRTQLTDLQAWIRAQQKASVTK